MKPTASQYAYAFLDLSRGRAFSEQAVMVERFLAFLIRQKETKKLPAILRNLQRLTDKAEGVRRVQVTTSETFDEKSLKILTKKIQHILKSEKLILTLHTNPHIIGGVKLQTDTEIFDGTVRRRLGELSKVLSE